MSPAAAAPAARAATILENRDLVLKVARDFFGRGLPRADILQAGDLGLVRAYDDYDPSRGASFATYARLAIRWAIADELQRTSGLVRVPKESWDPSRRRPIPLGAADVPAPGPGPLDVLVAEEEYRAGERTDVLDAFRAALPHLLAAHADVLALRHGLRGEPPMTRDEVMARLCLTRHRATTLEHSALAALRRVVGRMREGRAAHATE